MTDSPSVPPVRARRIACIVLAASAAPVAVWALLFPQSWYDDFPGAGHLWVSPTGPYNEHLVRDVGAAYLALLALAALGVVWTDRRTAVVVGAGWTVFSTPHLAMHVWQLGWFGTVDAIGQVVTLGGTTLIAGWLLVSGAREISRRSAR